MTYHILITDDLSPACLASPEGNSDFSFDVVHRPSHQELLEIIDRYDALIIRSHTYPDAELFARARRLRVVGRAGVGLDNVDVQAATTHGVLVMNTPEANTTAAAEHTFALLLALCRHLPDSQAALKNGSWKRNPFIGVQLRGKTLGIIGLGRIGSKVAGYALAFGMKVLAYDPYISEEVAERLQVTLLEMMDELLEQSDFISLHVPLTPETERFIGQAQVEKMKPGVRIVNCARGKIIDDEALLKGLTSGHIAGAALDVYSSEPPDTPTLKALLALDNVVTTPHLGGSTVEAQHDVSVQIVKQVCDALRETNFQNAVNLPFLEGSSYQKLHPYLQLAEKVGSLQMQLTRGRIKQVEVEFIGEEIGDQVKPLAVALLKGILQPILGENVNYVNAPILATQRGITISQTRRPVPPDYTNLVWCRVVSEQGERIIAGTLFGRSLPRIVQLDDFRMDALPQGHMLVTMSRDVPGVIGTVGTILARHGINIAEWRLGRTAPGDRALSIINLDEQATPQAIADITALDEVISVHIVEL
jgi:D-3-phosphoglycerate dehydrogenase